MKIKKIGIGLLSLCMLAGTTSTAFASTISKGNNFEQLSGEIKILDAGQTVEVLENAIDLNNKFLTINKEDGNINISVNDTITDVPTVEVLGNAIDLNNKSLTINKEDGNINVSVNEAITDIPNSVEMLEKQILG